MQVEGPMIYQMIRQTTSFRNMCDTLGAKIDRLARKIDFTQKKHLKTDIFACTNLGHPTFEGPGRLTVDTRSTSGLPLKTLGKDGSN